jgi:hypothetical protein
VIKTFDFEIVACQKWAEVEAIYLQIAQFHKRWGSSDYCLSLTQDSQPESLRAGKKYKFFILDGSDASHPDPDYSAVYVTLVTDSEDFKGYGITFTLGRGNEIVLHCVDSLRFLVINKDIKVYFLYIW